MSTSHDASAHAAMRALMMPATLPDPEQPGQEIEFNQTDRNVYAYLVYRAGGGRMCWKTVEEIKTDLGIGTRQTVCNATAKLRRAGLIEVKHRRRDSNHYRILDPGHRLYSGSSGNGATEWQQPPVQDVKETVFQEPQGVKETALLNVHPDVKETALLEPDDVKETALLGVLDVKETVQESLNQVSKITKDKGTKGGAPASRRPPARTTIPEGWQPNAEGKGFAINLGLGVPMVAAKFSAWHRKHATRSADWVAEWELWCLREVEMNARQPERRANHFAEAFWDDLNRAAQHPEDADAEGRRAIEQICGVTYGTA